MLYKLKELIFGLNEFEKTKIELRFNMITSLLINLKINELEDFEILEECIFKIKDQLRVKSSNLNKIVANPSKKLRKKDILNILEKLNTVKYEFLKKAFSAISVENKDNSEQTYQISNDNENHKNKEEEEEETNKPNMKKEIQENFTNEIKDEEILNNSIKILRNEKYKIILENGKAPHILISFKEKIDYLLLKDISVLFFETYSAHGTNIIIEKNRALVIPRFMDDNLLNLGTIKTDIEQDFEKILNSKKNMASWGEKETNNDESQENIDNPNQLKETQESEYKEYYNPKPQIKKTSKNDDISLDALLEQDKTKKTFKPKIEPQKDKSNISFEKSEPIEIEKKEVIVEKKEEDKIEIEKELNNNSNEKSKDSTQEETKSTFLETINPKHTLYKDDKIIAYLDENSQILGEIIIRPLNDKIIKYQVENDLSYMMIFSKIFSAILFEEMQAHGSNLLFDYKTSTMRIVVRYQDDNLPLKWNPKEESDGFLEDLRSKLLTKMNDALNKEPNNNTQNNNNKQNNENTKETTKTSKKTNKITHQKAKHILDAIKRIP